VGKSLKRLGISLYPGRTTFEKDRAYLETAAKYGFSRVFTCFISLNEQDGAKREQLKQTIAYAKQLGMEVYIDVNPRVFSNLGVRADDLSLFHDWGVAGIRLDLGFSGQEEAMMTYNPYGIKIEINMSQGTRSIDQILSYQPNKEQLTGCHNFYPHRYTGLSYDHFARTSSAFKALGIQTAAFVSSQSATLGPREIAEGLCTLEMHRELPIEIQAKHFFMTGWIDDVIIGNAYASEEELKKLSQITPEIPAFTVNMSEDATPLEKKIVFEESHVYRGDVSEFMIRSTGSRVKYKQASFPPHNTQEIRRGDVLIDNDHYGQYKGELQSALKPMKNDGRTNVVGRIEEQELFLLDYLKPWSPFRFERS
jgi:hypothetical protein